jgi:hypothetical protein
MLIFASSNEGGKINMENVMTDPLPRFGAPCGNWHRWFAWWPVKSFDQRTAWLRFVSRRCIQKHDFLTGGADFWFQYSIEDRT